MKKIGIPNNISRAFYKVGFKLKKHSPEILVVAGVIGTITSAIMACKATTKVNDVIDNAKEEVEKVHTVVNDEKYSDEYTEEDSKKDLAIIYAQTGIKLVKLYAPSVILGVLSIGGILASNNILRKRNVALAAAYATIDNTFKDYRKRVVERFGNEVDKQLRYNIKAKEIETTVVDENGEEKTVKETINVVDSEMCPTGYERFFDESCPDWTKDPSTNLMFLTTVQNYCNDLLRAQGYLFLNDVYKKIGLDPTKEGQIVGWIYDPDDGTCANCIDFGIYDLDNERKRAFVNGYERNILLDFNVDGNILEYM